MRSLLTDGQAFEIPDDWWNEAGMGLFERPGQFYAYKPDPDCDPAAIISVIPIALIKPLHRDPGVIKDFGGFERDRLVSVLKGFATGQPIIPIKLRLNRAAPYEYSIYDGYHRFRGSVAAGFTEIPAMVGKWGRDWTDNEQAAT
jgi:hypothetical protein